MSMRMKGFVGESCDDNRNNDYQAKSTKLKQLYLREYCELEPQKKLSTPTKRALSSFGV